MSKLAAAVKQHDQIHLEVNTEYFDSRNASNVTIGQKKIGILEHQQLLLLVK